MYRPDLAGRRIGTLCLKRTLITFNYAAGSRETSIRPAIFSSKHSHYLTCVTVDGRLYTPSGATYLHTATPFVTIRSPSG